MSPASGRPLRVVIVDDHPLFLDGVAALLDSVPDTVTVGRAASAEDAVRVVTLEHPDVVLMDVHLPGTSGVEATRRVVRASPETAVLVLTMADDEATVLAAMQAGARGYVLKGAGQEELLSAVRTVATGGVVFSTGVAARVLAALAAPPSPQARPVPGLTEREAEVLALLADGRSDAETAAALAVTTKTIQNTVSRILAKLQARDRVEAVLRYRDAGDR